MITRLSISAILFAVLIVPSAVSAQPTAAGSASSIDAIGAAADPSSAVAAYARALAAEPNESVAIEAAYLKKMVEFGVPMLAEAQAKDLILRQPDNAQAWAVMAHSNALRGETTAAMGQIQTAAQRDPNDPFIQRTAGQILAWYDAQPTVPDMPQSITNGIPPMRDALKGRGAFDEGYRRASEEYRFEPEADSATRPGPEVIRYDTGFRMTAAEATSSPYVYTAEPTYYYPSYAYEPYYIPPAYPFYGYYRPWWWWGSSFIFFNNSHGHKHHHHSDCLVPSKHRSHWGHGGSHGGRHSSRDWSSSGRGGGLNDGSSRTFNRGSRGGDGTRFVGPMPAQRGGSTVVNRRASAGGRDVVGPMPASRGNQASRGNNVAASRGGSSSGRGFVGPMPAARGGNNVAASRGSSGGRGFVGPMPSSGVSRSAVGPSRGGGGGGRSAAGASRGGGGGGGRGGSGGGGRGGGGGGRGR